MSEKLAYRRDNWGIYYCTVAIKLFPFGPPYRVPCTSFPVVFAWPVTVSVPSAATLYSAMVP
jgi:hypothetical protein